MFCFKGKVMQKERKFNGDASNTTKTISEDVVLLDVTGQPCKECKIKSIKASEKESTFYNLALQISTSDNPMFYVDRCNNFVFWNSHFAKLLGVESDYLFGKKCYEVFSGSDCNTDDCPMFVLTEGKKMEYILARSVCESMPLQCKLNAWPYVDDEGDFMGIVEELIIKLN